MSSSILPDKPQSTSASTGRRLERRARERENILLFVAILAGVWLVFSLGYLLIVRDGLAGYAAYLVGRLRWLIRAPWRGGGLIVITTLTYLAWRSYRIPGDHHAALIPAPDPYPDLRHTDDLYLGFSMTRLGKRAGEEWDGRDGNDRWYEQEHVVLPLAGACQNIQVTGAPGTGKSAALMAPLYDEAIGKHPRPPALASVQPSAGGRFADAPSSSRIARFWTWLQREACYLHIKLGNIPTLPSEPPAWHPYAGMTVEEAAQEYRSLVERHLERKWALFVLDLKGTLTDDVLRIAQAHGRAGDVRVLEPAGAHSMGLLSPLVDAKAQASAILAAHTAMKRAEGHPYWHDQMLEWFTHAIRLLQAVRPHELGFPTLNRMVRDAEFMADLLAEGTSIHMKLVQSEVDAEQVGNRSYMRPVVAADLASARTYFEHYLSREPRHRQEVESGILTHCAIFEPHDIAHVFSPRLIPTLSGFDEVLEQGLIVIARFTDDEVGLDTSACIGVHLLTQAQDAARRRRPRVKTGEVVRPFMICADEVQFYLNKLLVEFLNVSRDTLTVFVGAHQSQDQVEILESGLGSGFIGRTQTKIAFRSANGLESAFQAKIFGTRRVLVASEYQGESFHNVRRIPNRPHVEPHSEGLSGGQRVGEEDRFWVEPSDFEKLHWSADLAEAWVRICDGADLQDPRKILIVPYFSRQRGADALAAPAPPLRTGHAVARVLDALGADDHWLKGLVEETPVLIVEGLLDRAGELRGVRLTGRRGTVIAELGAIARCTRFLRKHFNSDAPGRPLIFAELQQAGNYFARVVGTEFTRPIALETLASATSTALDHVTSTLGVPGSSTVAQGVSSTLGSAAVSPSLVASRSTSEPANGSIATTVANFTHAELYAIYVSEPLPYPSAGGWEYCSREADDDALARLGTMMMRVYDTVARRAEQAALQVGTDLVGRNVYETKVALLQLSGQAPANARATTPSAKTVNSVRPKTHRKPASSGAAVAEAAGVFAVQVLPPPPPPPEMPFAEDGETTVPQLPGALQAYAPTSPAERDGESVALTLAAASLPPTGTSTTCVNAEAASISEIPPARTSIPETSHDDTSTPSAASESGTGHLADGSSTATASSRSRTRQPGASGCSDTADDWSNAGRNPSDGTPLT